MVVDSSVWLEILQDGPLRTACQKALHKQIIRVPTLVLHEVYKKLKSRATEELALEAIASLSQYEVLDMSREVAILAGDVCLQHSMSMADGIVLAHAEFLSDTLLTLDNDFAKISRAQVLRISPSAGTI